MLLIICVIVASLLLLNIMIIMLAPDSPRHAPLRRPLRKSCTDYFTNRMGVCVLVIICLMIHTSFTLLNGGAGGIDSLSRNHSAWKQSNDENGLPSVPAGNRLRAIEGLPLDNNGEPYYSPFEIRRPGDILPDWAQKSAHLRSRDIPVDREICFVHVGKTGGTSLSSALGFDYYGPNPPYVAGVLSLYTQHVFHNNINDCPSPTANYLITVREPLSRIQSAHIYERLSGPGTKNRGKNQAKIYEDCGFRTLNDLAEQGLAKNGTANSLCKSRAYNHIHGYESYGFHAYYNYQYYYKNLEMSQDHNNTIYVVRTEHITEDWNRIAEMMGDSAPALSEFPHSNPSEKLNVVGDEYLSEESRRLLCEALCQEIQMYKSILQQAVNINETDMTISLQELSRSCPREAQINTCEPRRQRRRRLS